MYWFSSPPYLRYAAALILVLAAIWVELRPSGTIDHPFTRQPIAAGTSLESSMFEQRKVPEGMLEPVPIEGAARHAIASGAPLLSGDVDLAGAVIPEGWWTVEVPLPADTQPGDQVRLVIRPKEPDGEEILADGLAIRTPPPVTDPFGVETTEGLVAIPGDLAATVASAAGDRRITVLVRKHTDE